MTALVKKIVVEAESNGAVRGYVAEPQVHLPSKNGKLDVAGAVGRTGLLTVSKDLRLKEPYQGIVQTVSGEIAEDLAFYLAESEQVPSALALGVYVETHWSSGCRRRLSDPNSAARPGRSVGGAYCPYPKTAAGHRSAAFREAARKLFWRSIYGDLAYTILDKYALAWQCSCSRERVEKALITLGREELDKPGDQKEKR